MKERLKNLGLQVYESHQRKEMFEPLRLYCERKRLDFEKEVTNWMYMHHDQSGIHFYKHVQSRNYLSITESGHNYDSVAGRVVDALSGGPKKRKEAMPTVLDMLKKIPGIPAPENARFLTPKLLNEKVELYHHSKNVSDSTIEITPYGRDDKINIRMIPAPFLPQEVKNDFLNQAANNVAILEKSRDLAR